METAQSLGFTLDYFRANISTIDISVVGFSKDFFEHHNYEIEIRNNHKLVHVAYKRYNQFYALYQVCKIKFKNLELKPFPSKYKIWNKTTERKQYFDQMLKRLVDFAQDHQSVRNKVLGYLFSFVEMEMSSAEKTKSEKSVSLSNYSQGSIDKKQRSEVEKTVRKPEEKPVKQTLITQKLKELEQLNSHILQDKGFKKIPKQNLEVDLALNTKEFYLKFEHQEQWRKKYLKTSSSLMEIYKNISYNTFQTKVELCGIKIQYLKSNPNIVDEFMQKMEFRDNQVRHPENMKYLSLYHPYDCSKLLVTCQEAKEEQECQQLQTFKAELEKASQNMEYVQNYLGVFNPIGKLYIILYKIDILFDIPQEQKQSFLIVRISTGAFVYKTREVPCHKQIKIKQGFIIPISNTFESIKIQLVKVLLEGWIREEVKQQIIASQQIDYNRLLTFNNDFKFEKQKLQLKDCYDTMAELQYTIRNMSQFSSIWAESFANQNDGDIINYQQYSNRQIISKLDVTLDRLLFLVGTASLFIQTTWRNIYFFKYPRLAQFVFSVLGIIFLFVDMNNVLYFLISAICLIIIYNHPIVNRMVKELADSYLTGGGLHEEFKTPQILSKSQFKFLKWSNNLERLRKEHEMQKHNKARQKNQRIGKISSIFPQSKFKVEKQQSKAQYVLIKGNNQYRVDFEEQGFYQKLTEAKQTIQELHHIINSVVNVIEKISSLYSWVDTRRTAYFLTFVVLIMFLSRAIAFRILGFVFCCHRIYKGKKFYEKHYKKNRKLARQTLSYLMKKSFKQILDQYYKRKDHHLIKNKIKLYQDKLLKKSANRRVSEKIKQEEQKSLKMSEAQSTNQAQYKLLLQSRNQIQDISNVEIPLDNEFLKRFQKQLQSLIPICLNLDSIRATFMQQQKQEKILKVQKGKRQSQVNSVFNVDEKKMKYFVINNNQRYLKLEEIISSIETCQSRLKLQKIFTKEGRTPEYEKLRQNTKQQPIIDVWLEDMIINYILNTPSKFYEVFHKKLKNQ